MLALLSLLTAHAAEHPFEPLPAYRNVAVITSATPRMHWYSASAIHHEHIGCDIGVPAGDEDFDLQDVVVRCAFPGDSTSNTPTGEPEPSGTRGVARRALRQSLNSSVAEHLRSPVRDVSLTWLGTWTQVSVKEFVPFAHIDETSRGAMWGEVIYALSTDGARPLGANAANYGLLYYANQYDPIGFSRYLSWQAPAEVEGTSVLAGRIHHPDDPRYRYAELTLREALMSDTLYGVDQTLPPTLAARQDETGLPEAYRGGITWAILGGESAAHIDFPVTLDGPVTASFTLDGADMVATLDLSAGTASLTVTGLAEVARAEVAFEAELFSDGDRVAVYQLTAGRHERLTVTGPGNAPLLIQPFYSVLPSYRVSSSDEPVVRLVTEYRHWPSSD